jgi:hypothetical protein
MKATDYEGIKALCMRTGGAMLANNTHAYLSPSAVDGVSVDIGIRLHGHLIAYLAEDGRVAIRDCGYVTTVTYDRLAQILPEGWRVGFARGRGTATNLVANTVEYVQAEDWIILCPAG